MRSVLTFVDAAVSANPFLHGSAPLLVAQSWLRRREAEAPPHNGCGTPAMSVPLYWTPDGLPIGSQFAAWRGGETTLLQLTYELEAARPWATRRPPVFAD